MKGVTTVVLALGFTGLVASIALHASPQSQGTSAAVPADAAVAAEDSERTRRTLSLSGRSRNGSLAASRSRQFD